MSKRKNVEVHVFLFIKSKKYTFKTTCSTIKY